ncbi:spore germination protein KC [Cytobacillus eiseniae]|uniref:Spore germination protein KC n=1 Tax=Cytobacillus eiseniae TaxID=762947 RepID=A0ABS4RD65_9BACI|nr:Ger(x)C family spore germination protein [Cytobacillus eiseniae]MBP2240341.1 spore germination protein KC [Cytobacillus eiseniae]
MKKSLLFLMCFCFMPTLTGCMDRVEMKDLAIIMAAGIDRLEDGQIRISVQIFIPRAITSGETGEDLSQGPIFVREGIGDNLANAVSMLQTNVPRRLFWGQCKIYIFGNELAKGGIRKEIDYLTRHPGPRGKSFLYVSEGKARGILTLVPPLERFSGTALRKLTEDEYGTKTTLKDVDMGLMGESESVSIPYIKKLESKESARKSHETIPVIDGTAIFKKDRMVGTLNIKETRGLLWLKDKVKRSTISIKADDADGEITLTPTLGKVKFIPEITEGHWIMNLNINIEGDIVQNETHLNLMNEVVLMKVKKKYEVALKERVTGTVEKLQQEYAADVVNFARRFHQKYPKEWRKVEDRWDEKFQEVKFKINVNATIRRPGYIGPPAALPKDEVIE